MSWRDNLQPASFRGVSFFVDSRDYEIGPKNIFHTFPYRDDAELENQGVLADNFVITGHVIQALDNSFDYMGNRDDLIEALKETESGILVDPYLGEFNVALEGKARITETWSAGGKATFQMTFKVVKEERPPEVVVDPVGFMDGIAGDTLNRISDAFGEAMDATADLAKLSNDINSASQGMISKIRELKSMPGSVISSATSIVSTANALANSVISTPCDLANAITGGFDSFLFAAGMLDDTVSRDILGGCSGRVQNQDAANRQSDELSVDEGTALATSAAALSTFGSDLPAITVSSPASAADQANRQANINLTRASGLLSACRIAVRTTFNSQDEANALLLALTALISDFLEYLGDEAGNEDLANQGVVFSNDEVYQSVKQLTPALKKSMDTIGANLAQIVKYDVGTEALSVLTLAYDRYEDLDRDEEIITQNKTLILNPCFIPNGKTIDLLSE